MLENSNIWWILILIWNQFELVSKCVLSLQIAERSSLHLGHPVISLIYLFYVYFLYSISYSSSFNFLDEYLISSRKVASTWIYFSSSIFTLSSSLKMVFNSFSFWLTFSISLLFSYSIFYSPSFNWVFSEITYHEYDIYFLIFFLKLLKLVAFFF